MPAVALNDHGAIGPSAQLQRCNRYVVFRRGFYALFHTSTPPPICADEASGRCGDCPIEVARSADVAGAVSATQPWGHHKRQAQVTGPKSNEELGAIKRHVARNNNLFNGASSLGALPSGGGVQSSVETTLRLQLARADQTRWMFRMLQVNCVAAAGASLGVIA